MITTSIKEKAGDILDHSGEYLNTFWQLAQAKLTRKAADLVAGSAQAILCYIAGFFVIFFAGMAAAWWLGDLTGNRATGFLIAAAFFLLLLAIILLLRKKIISPYIKDRVVRSIYEEKDTVI